jgi:hypothetical protein
MQTHTGSCHCGAVRFEAELDLSQPVIACNCSMCGRKGTLLSFVPATKFKLLSGEDSLTEYLFNTKNIRHTFCKVCGVQSFARGKSPRTGDPMVAVNVRCVDDADLDALAVTKFDGKRL